jgi:hypothetical protein
MTDDKRYASGIELAAMGAAEKGQVSDIIEMIGTEGVSEGLVLEIKNALIKAVEVATKKGLLSEAIDVIGAEGIPEAVQMEAVGAISKEKAGSWLGGLVGRREDIPEAVQMKIVDVLAEGGWVSEVLDIVGAGNISDSVSDKAKNALAKAVIVAGEYQVKDLSTEEKIEALIILARTVESQNPLQKDGLILPEVTLAAPTKKPLPGLRKDPKKKRRF